ncbi:acyl carrier protein [Streptomyces sp. NBC_00669]|uniref:acyl carrier protein n=1 Tax=unclassified Streptomyces TaxID=2593676 RepID=UPI002E34E31E|nr:acyl carrier protein [Streptomyces sp. NBC_00669]
MNATEERMAAVLSTRFKVERGAISPESAFGALRFDSLTLVELGLALEDEFGVPIEDGELTVSMTLRDAAELVETREAAL